MLTRQLSIDGAWLLTSTVYSDERGTFSEWYKSSQLKELTKENFEPVQANVSVSQAGVIRGIHYSLAPRGQAKLVTVLQGSILDVAVDVRIGSPTYGQYESVELVAGDGQAVFLRHDLAHAFQALENNTVVSYLVSSEYAPKDEKEISPSCVSLNIEWSRGLQPITSLKDRDAPDLNALTNSHSLPIYSQKG